MVVTCKGREIQEENLFKDADEHRAQGQTIPAVSRTPNYRTVWRKFQNLSLECRLSLFHVPVNVSRLYCDLVQNISNYHKHAHS